MTLPRIASIALLTLLTGCLAPVPVEDVDEDGSPADLDCDDNDAAISPDAAELCDGIDNNCDGVVDDNQFGAPTWFSDVDGDGYGDPASVQRACDAPAGTVTNADDCDDARDDVAPGADELCDARDNDCDGTVDEDAVDEGTWYQDGDGDGVGGQPVSSCTQPLGTVSETGDCDDDDPTSFPGNLEICDGVDNDCEPSTSSDGLGEPDADNDGVPACLDCDEANALIYPGAAELCDGIDTDCEPSTFAIGESDADGDGVLACVDCDDVDATSLPGGVEFCDGADNDCDGAIDASPALPGDTDADGVTDLCDLCPGFDDTLDSDGDGAPDDCDACPLDALDDSDGDGVCDTDDLCPGEDDTLDGDGDGAPDACDVCPLDALDDSDGDGACDTDDICPGSDDSVDGDSDGTPDGCDACPIDDPDDTDGDGVCESDDVCPGEDDTLDSDGDGVPDACDVCPLDALDDSDGDGSCDSDDVCPGNDDGVDGDGDGTPDGCDICPNDPLDDSDGDGVCDGVDVCPGFDDLGPDADGDGVPDACDPCSTPTTTLLFYDDVEPACPGGWTLGGDWQCGAPSSGPNSAFSGTNALATILNGNYNNGQSYAANTATSPPISLVTATAPQLNFFAWSNTEGSVYDGWNVKISTDGGSTFTVVSQVSPAYTLTVSGEPAWGGDESGAGWQNRCVDLNAFAGQTIQIQFSMRTDGSVNDPGVYIDDIAVSD